MSTSGILPIVCSAFMIIAASEVSAQRPEQSEPVRTTAAAFSQPCVQASKDSLFVNRSIVIPRSGVDSLTLTNCGSEPASFRLSLVGNGYRLLVDSITDTLAASASTTVKVQCTAQARGALTGVLRIYSNQVLLDTIPLAAIGVQVSIVLRADSIPVTSVNARQPFTVHFYNTGDITWSSGVPTISNSAEFVSLGSPITIAPGDSGSVPFEFTPTYAGTISSKITYKSATPLSGNIFGITVIGVATSGVGVVYSRRGPEALEQSFPNPCHDRASLPFSLDRPSTVECVLIDARGEQVKHIETGLLEKGDHVITLDLTDTHPGTYCYILKASGIYIRRALVLIR